jgi:putative ATP-dependent endonuclease of OLD family
MQIRSVHIHNFRSIADAKIDFHDYTLITGANNTGKSNLIDAIRAFYGDYKYSPAKDKPKFGCDSESWVEVEFELTDDEQSSLAEKYHRPNYRLIVRRFLATHDRNRQDNLFAYEGDEISEDQFYGASNIQKGKLGKLIYIPASSRVSDHMKTTGPSAWRDLLTDLCSSLVKSSPSYERLAKEFESFESAFKQEETDDERSLVGLETAINNDIELWDTKFQLHINPISPNEIIKYLISCTLIDNHLENAELEEQQFGQGFQRQLIFTLLRLAAEYQTPKEKKKTKDFDPELTLLLFEEPEAYLHPSQQAILYQSLRKMSCQESYQVVVSSHSPHFVSYQAEHIPSIIRLNRTDGKTCVGQIGHDRLTQIFADNQEINTLLQNTKYEPSADDLTADMEAVKYGVWLDSQRCELFFANHVLLVEGPTERTLLNHLFNTGEIGIPKGGVVVVDCFGKFNMHRFMNLLAAFQIRHSILMDGDKKTEGQTSCHTSIQEMIKQNATPFTGKIRCFSKDIEDFLGIERPTAHRKPQHMMLCIHQGRIERERLEKFKQLIEDLLVWERFDDIKTVEVDTPVTA